MRATYSMVCTCTSLGDVFQLQTSVENIPACEGSVLTLTLYSAPLPDGSTRAYIAAWPPERSALNGGARLVTFFKCVGSGLSVNCCSGPSEGITNVGRDLSGKTDCHSLKLSVELSWQHDALKRMPGICCNPFSSPPMAPYA